MVANFSAGRINGKTEPIRMAGIKMAGMPSCNKYSPGRLLARGSNQVDALNMTRTKNKQRIYNITRKYDFRIYFFLNTKKKKMRKMFAFSYLVSVTN